MKLRVYRVSKPGNLLEIGLLVLIIKTFISVSRMLPGSEWLDNLLTMVAVACLMSTVVLKKKYLLSTFIIYGLITFGFLSICMKVHSMGILISVITCLAVRNEDLHRIVNFLFEYELLFFCFHVILGGILTLCGMPYYVWFRGYLRYSLGFVHPNTLSALVFNLIIMWLWLNYEKIKWWNYVIIIGSEIIVYGIARTRTTLYCVIILLVLLLMFRRKQSSTVINKVAQWIIPVISLFIYYLVVNYEKGNIVSRMIDEALSHRIALGSYAFHHLGMTMWGRDIGDFYIVWSPSYSFLSGKFTFDNTYTYLMMNIGCAVLILIAVLFYFVAKMNNLQNNIFLIMWALYSVTEIHGLNCYMCFPILFVTLLFRTKRGNINFLSSKGGKCKSIGQGRSEFLSRNKR